MLSAMKESEEGSCQFEKTLGVVDVESLPVVEGGVGGQLCSSGDGGSRCEVKNRLLYVHGIEPCLPALFRRNLAIIVNSVPRRT